MAKRRKLAWFLSLMVLLFVMIGVGGATRLTKSGLSITEWRPVTGILPPLTTSQWQKEFTLYKKSPEYLKVNSHFGLEDFKGIFWWEYVHRLLGRVIFVVALALVFVMVRKNEISLAYAVFLPVLIALQGLIGWLMVKTGLNHRPSVSHYMLTLHFFLALTTLVTVYHPIAKMKTALPCLSVRSRRVLAVLGGLLLLQILYGCFTSGLKAGLYFGTFPLMGGKFLPSQWLSLNPWVSNFSENPVTVQWLHRWIGVTTGLYLMGASYYLLRFESRALARPLIHLISIVGVQIVLGILTLLNQVPVSLAVAHQLMAALIVLGFFNIWFRIPQAR